MIKKLQERIASLENSISLVRTSDEVSVKRVQLGRLYKALAVELMQVVPHLVAYSGLLLDMAKLSKDDPLFVSTTAAIARANN